MLIGDNDVRLLTIKVSFGHTEYMRRNFLLRFKIEKKANVYASGLQKQFN